MQLCEVCGEEHNRLCGPQNPAVIFLRTTFIRTVFVHCHQAFAEQNLSHLSKYLSKRPQTIRIVSLTQGLVSCRKNKIQPLVVVNMDLLRTTIGFRNGAVDITKQPTAAECRDDDALVE